VPELGNDDFDDGLVDDDDVEFVPELGNDDDVDRLVGGGEEEFSSKLDGDDDADGLVGDGDEKDSVPGLGDGDGADKLVDDDDVPELGDDSVPELGDDGCADRLVDDDDKEFVSILGDNGVVDIFVDEEEEESASKLDDCVDDDIRTDDDDDEAIILLVAVLTGNLPELLLPCCDEEISSGSAMRAFVIGSLATKVGGGGGCKPSLVGSANCTMPFFVTAVVDGKCQLCVSVVFQVVCKPQTTSILLLMRTRMLPFWTSSTPRKNARLLGSRNLP